MTKATIKLSDQQSAALRERKTISDKIRFLDEQGFGRADIARLLNKRYQHVRNVLVRTDGQEEGKTKTTFTVDARTFANFDERAKEIGLRRDSYLESVLPDALAALGQVDSNSEETEDLLREYYRSDPDLRLERGELLRVNLILDADIVERMNSECAAKRIPRDLFMDGLLDIANRTVAHAAEIIREPIDYCRSIGVPFCRDFLRSDAEADELRQEILEELLVVEAIAQVKNASVESTRRTYSALPLEQRARLRNHPEIREAALRLRDEADAPVDLAEFLAEDE